MNLTLIASLISAALSFGCAWQIQNWRSDALEKDRAEIQLESQRIASRAFNSRQENVITAQNIALTRTANARRDAAATRNELDRLRDESTATVARAQHSLAACSVAVDAFADVFGQCSSRYSELAQKADGHANDAQTLTDAWPKE